jgi:hypothetical protein
MFLRLVLVFDRTCFVPTAGALSFPRALAPTLARCRFTYNTAIQRRLLAPVPSGSKRVPSRPECLTVFSICMSDVARLSPRLEYFPTGVTGITHFISPQYFKEHMTWYRAGFRSVLSMTPATVMTSSLVGFICLLTGVLDTRNVAQACCDPPPPPPDECCTDDAPRCHCGTCATQEVVDTYPCDPLPGWDGDCCPDTDCCPDGEFCCNSKCLSDSTPPAEPCGPSRCCESPPPDECCSVDAPRCHCGDCVTQEVFDTYPCDPLPDWDGDCCPDNDCCPEGEFCCDTACLPDGTLTFAPCGPSKCCDAPPPPDKCCPVEAPCCHCGICATHEDCSTYACDPVIGWDGDCCPDNHNDCCPEGTNCCGDECIDDFRYPECPSVSTCCDPPPPDECCTPDKPVCLCGNCITQEENEALPGPVKCSPGVTFALEPLLERPVEL